MHRLSFIILLLMINASLALQSQNPHGDDFNVNCALIIGRRKESTDKKVSLNNALREYDVAV